MTVGPNIMNWKAINAFISLHTNRKACILVHKRNEYFCVKVELPLDCGSANLMCT